MRILKAYHASILLAIAIVAQLLLGSTEAAARARDLPHIIAGESLAGHDRVQLCCQGKKTALYIDRVRGIGRTNLFWPSKAKGPLVLHFREFGNLEHLAISAGGRVFETSLRELREPAKKDCAFRLRQDLNSMKPLGVVVTFDTACTKNLADRNLQVSWIDAYR